MRSNYVGTFEGKRINVVPDDEVEEITIPLSLMKWIDHLVDVQKEYIDFLSRFE